MLSKGNDFYVYLIGPCWLQPNACFSTTFGPKRFEICDKSLYVSTYTYAYSQRIRMANVKSEYKEAYCSGVTKSRSRPDDTVICTKSLTKQPVGGTMSALRRTAPDSVPPPRLPVCDEDYVASTYASADYGTHRIEPSWQVRATCHCSFKRQNAHLFPCVWSARRYNSTRHAFRSVTMTGRQGRKDSDLLQLGLIRYIVKCDKRVVSNCQNGNSRRALVLVIDKTLSTIWLQMHPMWLPNDLVKWFKVRVLAFHTWWILHFQYGFKKKLCQRSESSNQDIENGN